MNLTVRTATVRDAALIADMSRQTFYDTYAAWNTKQNMDKFLQQQFTRGRLIAEVGLPEHTFFLAYYGREPVGYVKLRDGRTPEKLTGKKTLEIARIYAVKEKIGNGVGAALMQASLQCAEEKGKDVVWLVVWKENHRALAFYRRWGFAEFDECDFILGNDIQRDWVMKKEL